jgi:hypothetical protein
MEQDFNSLAYFIFQVKNLEMLGSKNSINKFIILLYTYKIFWNCIQLIQMEWVLNCKYLISCEKTNPQNFRKLLFQITPPNNTTMETCTPETDDSKTFC